MKARSILGAAAVFAALAAPGALAQPAQETLAPADWNAIRAVVTDQRDAIVAGDARRAYAYAAPGIRARFGDPATFLAMIRASYAQLADARDARLLDGAVIEGRVIQPLQLVMPDNAVWVALYTMERQRNGHWRISGCVLAPSTLRAT